MQKRRHIGMMHPQAKHCGQLPEARTETSNGSPPELAEGINLTDTLISDFWPPELGENKFLLL